MPFRKFKGGKLPPRRSLKIPALSDFLDRSNVWPHVPAMGWEAAVKEWGMLGNDKWGDCACAGIMHLLQAQSANAGNPLHGTLSQTLALYSAVTGFDIHAGDSDNNPTDQGTVLVELLEYIQKHGVEMTDATGKTVVVEIVGFASLDIYSVAQRRYASYIFGGSYLGVNLPEVAETDLTNWTDKKSPIAGGHCIPQVGEGSLGGKIVSWGEVIPCTNGFFASYLDEGYIVVSKVWLNAQGKSPSGLDLNAMLAAMKKIQTA